MVPPDPAAENLSNSPRRLLAHLVSTRSARHASQQRRINPQDGMRGIDPFRVLKLLRFLRTQKGQRLSRFPHPFTAVLVKQSALVVLQKSFHKTDGCERTLRRS